MKRLALLLLLATLSLSLSAQAKTLTSIAAVVNNDIISTYQLDQAIKQALAQSNDSSPLSTSQFDNLKISLLEQLINDKLIEQRTQELALTVQDSEVEGAIGDIQVKNSLTRETLIQALAAQGMTIESYREKIRREILRYKLMNREINYKVLVTSGEVRDYFREHIEDYRVPATVRVNRISFPIPPAASEQQLSALNEQVQAVRAQLQTGADFEQLLTDQSAASGGDMGDMVEADMAEPLQEAIKGLNQGEVSEVLQLNGQLHLLQVSLRTAGDPDLFDRVQGEIEKKLRDEKTDARFKEWQQEIRANAFIDKRL